MPLKLITTADANLNLVQQNVKRAIDAVESALPSTRTFSTSITADYTVKTTDLLILAKAPAAINITLPEVSACGGRQFIIKNLATSANINVRGSFINGAAQSVDGVSPYVIPGNTGIIVYSDGKQWWLI